MSAEANTPAGFPQAWWYPACRSDDLARRPVAVELMARPLVLFRDGGGQARALVDRCPHRNLPLSLGRVRGDGLLECAYHGWRFDGSGGCVGIPGLSRPLEPSPTRAVENHQVTERDGFVWVWGEAGTTPTREPFALPSVSGQGSGEVIFPCDLECTLHAALENSLDVPHTAFLHGGLFRGGDERDIVAIRRDLDDGVEVRFVGEPVRFGPFRPRAETALTFDHWDRFFLPSIAQVEYRVDGWLRIVNTILHLPMSPFRTRAWFVVRFWTRFPTPLVRPIVSGRGRQILRQDAKVLALQAENVRRFGGERYSSTELDLFGNAIWRLLRRAERAQDEPTATRPDTPDTPDMPGTADTVPGVVANGAPVKFRI